MNEISLWQVLNIIIKRLWIIILVAILVAGITFVYNSNYVDPVYLAQSSVLATNGGIVQEDENQIENEFSSMYDTSSKIGSSDVASSLNIVDTYIDILKTYSFYEKLAAQPELTSYGFSATQLKKMTTVERRSSYSLFIDINVKYSDAATAIIVANSIANLAPEYIQSMITNSYVLPADKCISAYLTSPLTVRNSILTGLIAAFVMVVIFILIAATDNTVKSEDEITKRYNVAVLGVVPDFETNKSKGAKK